MNSPRGPSRRSGPLDVRADSDLASDGWPALRSPMHVTQPIPPDFRFEVLATDSKARSGVLQTAHGPIETPAFMPVGTAGTVKGMTADGVRMTGSQCVLANTYHLMLRPGADRIASLGGLHRFMDWPGPILDRLRGLPNYVPVIAAENRSRWG